MEVEAPESGLTFPTIAGYTVSTQIGGGGFSLVYRAVNTTSSVGNSSDTKSQVAACKIVNLFKAPMHGFQPPPIKELQKEVQVHKALKHPYILDFIHSEIVGRERMRDEGVVGGLYMLLELAEGGDLFDKIAPDVGVPEDLAKFYFSQMASGLDFIHGKGIAHRDLKPENLLLAANGNLKITDFGLCAVFRHKGKERLLSGRCGSLPYVAPELGGPTGTAYAAEPVDIWGMGVVLYTLLVGNTPWDEPSDGSPEFCAFRTGELLQYDPWTRIRGQARLILLAMLTIDPGQRITMKGIFSHPWCMTPSQLRREQLPEALTQGLRSTGMMGYAEPVLSGAARAYAASRNERMAPDNDWMNNEESIFMRGTGNITQAGDQIQTTTRFWMALPPIDALNLLAQYFQATLGPDNVRPSQRFSQEGGVGGAIRVGKEAGLKHVEGWVVVKESDSLVAEGQSLVVMRRSKGTILHWRAFWWTVVRARELEGYIVHGDMSEEMSI